MSDSWKKQGLSAFFPSPEREGVAPVYLPRRFPVRGVRADGGRDVAGIYALPPGRHLRLLGDQPGLRLPGLALERVPHRLLRRRQRAGFVSFLKPLKYG